MTYRLTSTYLNLSEAQVRQFAMFANMPETTEKAVIEEVWEKIEQRDKETVPVRYELEAIVESS